MLDRFNKNKSPFGYLYRLTALIYLSLCITAISDDLQVYENDPGKTFDSKLQLITRKTRLKV